jgi:hypothetical protein
MRARRRRLSWEAALILTLCVGAGSLAASSTVAEGLPDLPTTTGAPERLPDLPAPASANDPTNDPAGAPAESAAADDQLDSSDASALVKDQRDSSATTAWYACATGEAAHLDDGRSDAATIADALATSCQSEWDASKAEQCKTSDLEPAACAMLADKLDANRRSYDIKVVLALRAKKTQAAAP